MRRVAAGISANNLTGYSAQFAFYFFLSLFPLLLFLVTLLAYLPIHHLTHTVLALFAKVLPAQALALVKGDLEGLLRQHRGGLLSFGVAFALYSAGNAVIAVGAGLNQTYGIHEGRPYWRVLLTALLLVPALALVFLAALTIFFCGPIAAHAIAVHLGMRLLPVTLTIIRWPTLLLAAILVTGLLYRFAPDVRHQWRWISPGSMFVAFGWMAASLVFGVYVKHFGSYNKTYGSIGAVIVLLTWMYLGGLVLFIGGQIDASIGHAASRDDQEITTPEGDHGPAGSGHTG